jgi:hypothetical protein
VEDVREIGSCGRSDIRELVQSQSKAWWVAIAGSRCSYHDLQSARNQPHGIRTPMSIDAKTCQRISRLTVEMWEEKAAKDEVFLGLTRGKERGHKMADFVDERTTALLKVHFVTRFQSGKGGLVRARSMGDVWLKSGGIFNPINVKTGVSGANGQPNLVSLKKLLRALVNDQIDSYYLLFVKFELGKVVRPKVFLVDLLEHLEFATYDDGPGQMMLLEEKFFVAMESCKPAPATSIVTKIDRLFALLKDGNRRLIQNRERTIADFEKLIAEYKSRPVHAIDQTTLGFVDEPN